MNRSASFSLRENAPLVGVLALLVLAFAALVVFKDREAGRSAATEAGDVAQTSLQQLPASAQDNRTILSILDPDAARARNAEVPFADTPLVSAPAFRFRGTTEDHGRARECLALAAMAEAGSGDTDQRAVMQVVLNRVRHAAFAPTICGVVFEGSQRPTGCQFTFTCDGSLTRRYPAALWRAARERADDALDGYVHAAVGTATHYHADYVYPYWSGKLDKIAAVGPHLFFRWRGDWGSVKALSARYTGGEPDPADLQYLAQGVDRPEDLLPRLAQQGTAVRSITPATVAASAMIPDAAGQVTAVGEPVPAQPGVHLVLVSADDAPETLIARARALCPGDRFCQVYGWDDAAAIPAKLPLSVEARRTLRFSFLPARAGNGEVAYFDCRLFVQSAPGTCLPRPSP